jgi:hypothetical protein
VRTVTTATAECVNYSSSLVGGGKSSGDKPTYAPGAETAGKIRTYTFNRILVDGPTRRDSMRRRQSATFSSSPPR